MKIRKIARGYQKQVDHFINVEQKQQVNPRQHIYIDAHLIKPFSDKAPKLLFLVDDN